MVSPNTPDFYTSKTNFTVCSSQELLKIREAFSLMIDRILGWLVGCMVEWLVKGWAFKKQNKKKITNISLTQGVMEGFSYLKCMNVNIIQPIFTLHDLSKSKVRTLLTLALFLNSEAVSMNHCVRP